MLAHPEADKCNLLHYLKMNSSGQTHRREGVLAFNERRKPNFRGR
jgi:hypothetical protein